VIIVCLEVFALEDKDWLHVLVDVLGCFELFCSTEVGDTELKHIENMAVKNTPKYEIVWSLFLVAADGKETAVVLNRLILDQTDIFHGNEVMSVSHKHLHSISALEHLQVLQQIVHGLT